MSTRLDDHCQLVVDYAPRAFPAGGALVERKHDGIRASWLGGRLLTRSGVPIWSSAHLWASLAGLESALGGSTMVDAEYVEPGGFAPTLRRFMAGLAAGRPVTGHGAVQVFDAVPLAVWRGEAPGIELWRRKLRLRESFEDGDHLRFVGDVRAGGDAQVQTLAAAAISRGEEGIVVKDPASLHRAGRSPAWQRIKRDLGVDLPVIGHAPLKGDPRLLGALIVDHHGTAVRVAKGFTDLDRALLYHHPDRLVGRIAEIGAMEATDTGSLRSPRFRRWRDDKSAHLGARP